MKIKESLIGDNFTADDSIWNDPKVLRSREVKSIVAKIYLDEFDNKYNDSDEDILEDIEHHYTTSELVEYIYNANRGDALDTPELNRAVEKALSVKNFYGEARMKNRIIRESFHGNEDGYDDDGYDEDGFDRDGFNYSGYDIDGYDEEGFDEDGYDEEGFDDIGMDARGFDRKGFSKDGYDEEGFDKWGYDEYGYDIYGYDKDGFDADNESMFNDDGTEKELVARGSEKSSYTKNIQNYLGGADYEGVRGVDTLNLQKAFRDRVKGIKEAGYTQNYRKGDRSDSVAGKSVKEIGAIIRKQIRAKAKELGIKVGLSTSSSSIRITIKDIQGELFSDIYREYLLQGEYEGTHLRYNEFAMREGGFQPYAIPSQWSPLVEDFEKYCTDIMSSYNEEDNDAMVDYFNSKFYGHFSVDWELEKEFKDKLKLKENKKRVKTMRRVREAINPSDYNNVDESDWESAYESSREIEDDIYEYYLDSENLLESNRNKRKSMKEGGGVGVEIIFDDAEYDDAVDEIGKSGDFEIDFRGHIAFESYEDAKSTSNYAMEESEKGTIYVGKKEILARLLGDLDAVAWEIVNQGGSVPEDETLDYDLKKLASKIKLDSVMVTALENYIYGASYIRYTLDEDVFIEIEADVEVGVEYEGEFYYVDFEGISVAVNFTKETCYAYGDLDTYDDEEEE